MEFHKTIIQGRFEFGNPNSFDKVYKMYIYRAENYYKEDIIFKDPDEIFNRDLLVMEVPRYVGKASDKSWRNTVDLFNYCSQFAVSGQLRAWQTETGKILNYAYMEPRSEKAAVIHFMKGKELLGTKGKEQEALDSLTKAIEKYNRHAQAYERRAWVNYILKRYHDAMRDYSKALKIDNTLPDAYYGRAKIHILKKEYDQAIENLDKTLKFSIALQSIYWKARRAKAQCHIELKQYEKAAFDLKLFTKRNFDNDPSNLRWRRFCLFIYGKVLLELNQFDEALDALNEAITVEENYGSAPESRILYFRGIAKKKAGKSGFIKDLKQAADLGNKEASILLKENA